MKELFIKVIKILSTVVCVSFIATGIFMMTNTASNVINDNITLLYNVTGKINTNKSDDHIVTIIFMFIFGVLPIYLMWFRKDFLEDIFKKIFKSIATAIAALFILIAIIALFSKDPNIQDNKTFYVIFLLLISLVILYFVWFRNYINSKFKKIKNTLNDKLALTNTQSNKLTSINFKNNFIPLNIFNLLWFQNGRYKNYTPNIANHNINGLKFTIYMNTDVEPSVIDVNLPIKKPKNIMFVEALGYFPRYEYLSPEQRWVYLNWLQDIRKQVDIGYVFLFYYGLERWLFTDNYEQAFLTILILRKYHKNNSFQGYSFSALTASLLFHDREDLFEKLIDVSDDISVSGLYLYVKTILNIGLNADEIMSIASDVEFSNKRYIKAHYDLFKNILIDKLNAKYGTNFYPIQNLDIKKCSSKSFNIVANTSLSPRDISLPNITSNKEFKKEINILLTETHEEVKEILKKQRKNKNNNMNNMLD